MKSIEKFENQKITVKEMNNVLGGMSMEDIIYHLWIGTPEGGSSTWTNTGSGCFEGEITMPDCSCKAYQVFCYAMP